jgi:hypothetical protein
MTILALPAPTVTLGGVFSAGTVLPATEPNAMVSGNTGLSFVNNGAMFLRLVVAGGGAGTVTFNLSKTVEGQIPAPFTQALANSTAYIYGPFSPSDFNDVNGLVQVTWAFVTGNTAGLYFIPGWRT